MDKNGSLLKWIRSNLRVKFALGLALPLLIILSTLSVANYLGDKSLAEQQLQNSAERIGDLALGSLRHGMLLNNPTLISEVMQDLVALDDIHQAQLVDMGGDISLLASPQNSAAAPSEFDYTCTLCHQFPAEDRPRSIRIGSTGSLVRVASPIPNDPDCHVCHGNEQEHLGMLLVDISFSDLESRLQQDLQTNLMLSGVGTIMATLIVYMLSHWLVVSRVERFSIPVAKITSGDLGARIDHEEVLDDELGGLARAFNQMAEQLERQKRASDARSQVRQRAIIEERNRIARELHDGLSQLLGYLNAKAIAARLKVQAGDKEGAADLLRQLETASKELFKDVRTAILALKSSSSAGLVFPENLRTFVERFEELSGLTVDIEITNQPLPHEVSAETELQLLRITQEALANIYKHAEVDRAYVRVSCEDGFLILVIEDTGAGFDPQTSTNNGSPNYGMSTMAERAASIGAQLTVEAAPGKGTRILVRAPLEER